MHLLHKTFFSRFLLAFLFPGTAGFGAEPTLPMVSQSSPASTLVLRAREPGYVDELLVERGTSVVKGQIVARLDCWRQLYNIEVAKLRAENQNLVNMAEADLRQKEAEREDASAKFKRRQISEAQLVAATTQWEMATSRLEMARDAVEQAKLELQLAERALEDRFVRSPFPGKVVEMIRTLGERTLTGDGIVTVGDFSKLKAEIPLSKDAASKLAVRGYLLIKTPRNVPPAKALIESISAVPNSPGGDKAIRLIFDNPEPPPSDPPDASSPQSPNPFPSAPPPARFHGGR